jgi:hypothetical protein
MRTPLTPPADAYATDADRAGPEESAHSPPEWLVRLLAQLIFFLLQHVQGMRLRRCRRMYPWWRDRPDLPAGSAQGEAASVRGPFGRSIAWMCHRHGVGPGHPDWPELSRAIVAFGGSLKGFRAGAPPCGLYWWENPGAVPGMVHGFGAPAATTLLQRQAIANAALPAPRATQAQAAHAEAAHARLPAPWLSVSAQQFFARAGPGPSTGPPGCPGLPTLSCLTHGAGAWPAPPS